MEGLQVVSGTTYPISCSIQRRILVLDKEISETLFYFPSGQADDHQPLSDFAVECGLVFKGRDFARIRPSHGVRLKSSCCWFNLDDHEVHLRSDICWFLDMLQLKGSKTNFVVAKISINGEMEWFGTFIYAPLYTDDKQKFWETLAPLRNDVNAKWCALGDFNVVARPEDKYGGNPFDHNTAKWYYEFLDQTFLMNYQVVEDPLLGRTKDAMKRRSSRSLTGFGPHWGGIFFSLKQSRSLMLLLPHTTLQLSYWLME
ncbi:hypothetical protein V6N11_007578 [Hibiscus sabdariffa]|uniref:Uncharacterized protein n=1 Tax=Hibiscus sabdariffa TaxID=183260 RepID=A0ABR1ZLH2_9ROSI